MSKNLWWYDWIRMKFLSNLILCKKSSVKQYLGRSPVEFLKGWLTSRSQVCLILMPKLISAEYPSHYLNQCCLLVSEKHQAFTTAALDDFIDRGNKKMAGGNKISSSRLPKEQLENSKLPSIFNDLDMWKGQLLLKADIMDIVEYSGEVACWATWFFKILIAHCHFAPVYHVVMDSGNGIYHRRLTTVRSHWPVMCMSTFDIPIQSHLTLDLICPPVLPLVLSLYCPQYFM